MNAIQNNTKLPIKKVIKGRIQEEGGKYFLVCFF